MESTQKMGNVATSGAGAPTFCAEATTGGTGADRGLAETMVYNWGVQGCASSSNPLYTTLGILQNASLGR